MNYLFYLVLVLTGVISILFWYASYSTKSGFAVDQNKNQIPDKWEKASILFKFKSIIYLLLGFILGVLFNYTEF